MLRVFTLNMSKYITFIISKHYFIYFNTPLYEKLYGPHSGPCHLSAIPVKDAHLFKINESIFNFYLKLHTFK